MPVNTEELMTVLAQLSWQENLQVSVSESAKGACIVGGSAFTGGLVAGPVGLAVGGFLGSLVSLAYGQGKYKSVYEIIMNMTPREKEQLAASIHRAVSNIRLEDFTFLLPLLLNDSSLKQLAINEIMKFFQK